MATREEEVRRRLQEATDAPAQEAPDLGRLRSRLEEARGTGETPTRFDALRTRLEGARTVTGTPDGDPDGAVVEPQGGNLVDFARNLFTEERGRLGLGAEAARGFARVPGMVTEGIGGIVQAAASVNRQLADDAFEREQGTLLEELRPGTAERNRVRGRRFADFIERVGEEVTETGTTSREFFPASQSVTQAEELDLTDPNVLVSGGAEAVGQLGTQLLLAAGTGGGSAVAKFLMFAGPTVALEGGNAYLETKANLLDAGLDEETAEATAAGAAATTGVGALALERIPAARFLFKRIPGAERVFGDRLAAAMAGRAGIATGILSGAVAEGVEEAMQEAWAATVQDVQVNNPDAWEDIGPRLQASLVFGAIGGGFGGAVTTVADRAARAPVAPEGDPAPDETIEPEGEPEAPIDETIPPSDETKAPIDETTAPEEVDRRVASVRRRLSDLVDPSQAEERRRLEEDRRALQDEVFRDELTGVRNQKAWVQARDRLNADPEREFVWFDGVNFKAVNTFEGQEGGDAALAAIGSVLNEAQIPGVQARDIFRPGGDEFVLDVPFGQGEAIGRLLRERIGERSIGDTDLLFSVRFGVGDQWQQAERAAETAKKAETTEKFRTVTEEGIVEAAPDAEAEPGSELRTAESEPAAEAPSPTRAPPAPEPDAPVRKARLIPTRREDGSVEFVAEEVTEAADRPVDEPQDAQEAAETVPPVETAPAEEELAGARTGARARTAPTTRPDLVPGTRVRVTESSADPDFDTVDEGDIHNLLSVDELAGTAEISVLRENDVPVAVTVPLDVLAPAEAEPSGEPDFERAGFAAVREIFGFQPSFRDLPTDQLMTAIDEAFDNADLTTLPGGIEYDVEPGGFAHLRGRPNPQVLFLHVGDAPFEAFRGQRLRDLVRRATQATDLELEAAGQILALPTERITGRQTRTQTDPTVRREATAAETSAQREAEAEVAVLMGGEIATPEQMAEIDRIAEEVTDGATELVTDPSEVAGAEPAGDLQGADVIGAIEPAPPGGRPGGPRDLQDDGGTTVAEESQVDAGPEGEGGDGSRATGDRTGSRPGDTGSRSPGRLSGLNLRITGDLITEVGGGGPITKTRRNLRAIEILKDVEAQGRQATADEQAELALYAGWGGIPQVFNLNHKRFGEFARELQALLTPEEYRAARESTVNAHFTSTDVIQEMHGALERMGLPANAQLLEPAMGIGHFMGLGPQTYDWFGVELDSLTGRMAQLIYPRHEIHQRGFEATPLPDGHFDAAVSNVPFGDFVVDDPAYRDLRFSIHNYFFAKSLDKVRPGGVVAFITSHFTMDAKDSTVRKYLAERADFVGAVRLPETAFRKSSGTDVVTDIIFLRKRAEGEEASALDRSEWLGLESIATEQGDTGINAYYAQNPDQVVGTHALTGSMHGADSLTVTAPEGALRPAIAAALSRLPSDIVTRRPSAQATAIALPPVADAAAQEGAFRVVNDAIMQVREGRLQETKVPKTQVANVKALIGLRDAARELLRLQLAGETDAAIEAQQQELNTLYDRYVKRRGPINKEKLTKSGTVLRPNYTPFRSDPDAPLVAALEVFDSESNTATKAPIFSQRVLEQRREITEVDQPGDSLPVSLAERGRVDLEFMAELAGVDQDALIADLRGRIFQDPHSREWQTDDEYLSGNVRQKLILARAAGPSFAQNVAALEKVQPDDLLPSQIDVSIGAPWIPSTVYEDFINELLETSDFNRVEVGHSEALATFTIESGQRAFGVKATREWGTERVNAVRIFEGALNQRAPTVYDKIADASVKNVEETLNAREKLQDMRDRFAEWVWQRPDAEALAREYNDRFNNTVVRRYDGSHLRPPGISPGITPLPQQLDGAWRVISSGNTMLAHVVGAGKTFTMQIASMEEKRMGLANKPVHVVPNHMLEQYTREFLQLYPSARILAAEKKDFAGDRRRALFARIATGDWDAVVMTHSAFKRIDVSRETREAFIRKELDELEEQIRQAQGEKIGDTRIIKVLVKAQKRAEERLSRLMAAEQKDVGVTFEELGMDRIYLDEAHLFKNLGFTTKMEGISSSQSQRATDLFMKIGYLEELHPGRSSVFATATPIANSLAEVYTMMRYLQLPLLKERGLEHFDAWAAQFGETVTAAEIKPDGSGFRMKERFARFRNVPELSQMFRQVWDVKRAADLNLATPRIRGGTARVVVVPASNELTDFVQELAQRADNIRNVDPSVDNMLKITTEGRKAALDMRLIDPTLGRDPDGKVEAAADEMFDIWTETADERLTQLAFIDFSAPKPEGFHVYGELKELLIERGVPEDEIAFIHDAKSDLQKGQLFQKVRDGRVRILLGSTEKMGVGTNVQKLLVALHHLDAPWRPADVEQRDGRGVRQGNENDEIQLIRYVTEGSFDAYMWQGLERKQFFIEQIMTGDPSLRSVEDISGSALNASETKALASGNPLAIEKSSVDSDVARLQRQQRSHIDDQFRIRQQVAKLPGQIESAEQRLEATQADAKRRIPTAGEKFAIRLGGSEYSERGRAGEVLVEAIARYLTSEATAPRRIGEFAGFDLELAPPGFAEREDRPTLRLVGNLVYQHTVGELSGTGLIRRLEAMSERIPKGAPRAETDLKRLRTELRQAGELAGQTFARQDELDRLLERQAAINRELNLTGRQVDEQVAQNDDGVGDEVYGEGGLTRAELEERGDAGFLDVRTLFRRSTRDQLITSDFAEVEARYQASKGIERPGLAERARKAFNDFVASMRRAHPEINPDESTTMALTTDVLRQFSSARDWSLAMAYSEVRKVMDGLTEAEVDLVTRMLVLPDIQKDVEEGLYEGKDELPFGYTEESLAEDLAKFSAAAAANTNVADALQRRGAINRELTKKLVQAELLPKAVLEDDRYYHRQVLKYFHAQDFTITGVGGRDVRLRRKGFQQQRVGGGDFNTAYQESEVEWMSQGFELLARIGTLERLQQLNDVKGNLKAEAKLLNQQAALEAWADMEQEGDPFLVYRTRIAFSNAGLAKMADAGDLTSVGGRYDDLIEQLGDGYDQWKTEQADLAPADRTPFAFQHGDWFGFLSHLLDNNLPGAMQAGTIFKAIRQREALTAELAGPAYIDRKNPKALLKLAPDGYVTWQPERGTHLFLGLTVEERVLEAALSGERPLEREDVRQQLVVGGPKETWIIPGNVARALDNVRPFADTDGVDSLWRAGQQSWKQWILLNPIRFLRYNLNNMSGDVDIAFAYDPAIVKGAVQAAKDLALFFRGKGSPELRKEILEWTKLGTVGSTLRVAEIPDISEAGAFQHLTRGKLNPGARIVNRYWTSVRGFTDWRENILRLSAARHFDARLAAGEQNLYAASRRTEIDAITNRKDKAAKLARELIGDYGAISKGGVWLRRHMIPFYSWIEINAPRYYRLLANSRHEGQGTNGRGRRVSAIAIKKSGTLVLKMNVLFLLANLWNHLFFPDEEEELQRGRRQLHLILGRREDGSIRSLRVEGALSDALEWFNLQDYPSDIADLLAGRKDILDEGAEFVKAPVERLVNSWEPFTKTMFETFLGRSTFPTVFEEGASFKPRTRPIRDRGEHVARSFSLDRLYNRVTGKPRRTSNNLLDDFLGTVLLYSTDPGEAAFWQTRDMVSDYLEETGSLRADISPTRRSTALYYWKKAVQWGDDAAAQRWEAEYRNLGGTDQGMRQSLRLSAPLGGIAQSEEAAFIASLTTREQDIVASAEDWFFGVFEDVTPPGPGARRRRTVRQQRGR